MLLAGTSQSDGYIVPRNRIAVFLDPPEPPVGLDQVGDEVPVLFPFPGTDRIRNPDKLASRSQDAINPLLWVVVVLRLESPVKREPNMFRAVCSGYRQEG